MSGLCRGVVCCVDVDVVNFIDMFSILCLYSRSLKDPLFFYQQLELWSA